MVNFAARFCSLMALVSVANAVEAVVDKRPYQIADLEKKLQKTDSKIAELVDDFNRKETIKTGELVDVFTKITANLNDLIAYTHLQEWPKIVEQNEPATIASLIKPHYNHISSSLDTFVNKIKGSPIDGFLVPFANLMSASLHQVYSYAHNYGFAEASERLHSQMMALNEKFSIEKEPLRNHHHEEHDEQSHLQARDVYSVHPSGSVSVQIPDLFGALTSACNNIGCGMQSSLNDILTIPMNVLNDSLHAVNNLNAHAGTVFHDIASQGVQFGNGKWGYDTHFDADPQLNSHFEVGGNVQPLGGLHFGANVALHSSPGATFQSQGSTGADIYAPTVVKGLQMAQDQAQNMLHVMNNVVQPISPHLNPVMKDVTVSPLFVLMNQQSQTLVHYLSTKPYYSDIELQAMQDYVRSLRDMATCARQNNLGPVAENMERSAAQLQSLLDYSRYANQHAVY